MVTVKNARITVALVGNPNCGKTTIFNKLTGEKQAVGNYSGVTVEKVEGCLERDSINYNFVDLPGIYSLTTFSRDEVVARDYLLFEHFDVVVNVVDASNIERNLFLTLQLKELGLPMVVVFNMCDLAKSRGIVYDLEKLEQILAAPIVEVVGSTGRGVEQITDYVKEVIVQKSSGEHKSDHLRYSNAIETEIHNVVTALDIVASKEETSFSGRLNKKLGIRWLLAGQRVESDSDDIVRSYLELKDRDDVAVRRRWLAIKLLENDKTVVDEWQDNNLNEVVKTSSRALSNISSVDNRVVKTNVPVAAKFAAERYGNVRKICAESVRNEKRERILWSDRCDRILTHPFWGLLIFFCAMYLVFWLTFALGNYPVGWLETLFQILSDWLNNSVWGNSPDSLLRSLIVDGIIGGVGGVLTFFPNIFILFGAIAILEESGYMARGAFLTDRFLRRFGLTGKSFIPMLVGFGCSIPAVMATRIIEERKSRLCTIFVVPLMSCGARFPIYMLIIPAFLSEKWQAPALWCVYFAGIIIAAIVSSVLSVTTFRNEHTPLLIELPAYHSPTMRTVGRRALERGWLYLRKAGTTILGVAIALWAISTFPMLPKSELAKYEQERQVLQTEASSLGIDIDNLLVAEEEIESADEIAGWGSDNVEPVSRLLKEWHESQNAEAEAKLEYSIAGKIGKAFEPVIEYAGFDWRIGTALVGALAAKEIFVAQLGIVFKVGTVDENSKSLRETIAERYSPLVGVCMIIFCLVGAPCFATFVVVAKEASWHWAIAQWGVLTFIGFILAVLTFQIGSFFHIGL